MHLGNNHKLRLAGVDQGTKVYLGQIRTGEVDRIDQANHRMTAEEVKTANAFIAYIRDQLAAAHIKLPQKKPGLRLVKNAA
jgi:hypothetical protein